MSKRNGTESTAREVSSENCSDVVSALALITALAIDPHADSSRRAQGNRTGESQGPGARTVATARASAPAPAAMAVQVPSTDAPVGAIGPRRRPWLFGVGVHALVWPSAPLIPLGGVSLTLGNATLRRSSPLPAWRLSIIHFSSTTVHATHGGAARFALSTAQVDVCPAVVRGPSWALLGCMGIEGGLQSAAGIAQPPIESAQRRYRPWWALHQTLEVLFSAGPNWSAGLAIGMNEPLMRDRFVFDRLAPSRDTAYQTEVVRVPAWAPEMAIRVLRRF